METKAPESSRWGALGIVLVVALAVRLLALVAFASVQEPRGDEGYYLQKANAIHEGRGHPGAFRAPGYPAFIAGVFRVLGTELDGVRWVQIAISLLMIAGIFHWVNLRFGGRAALISGLACALSPPLVHYTHFLWSEGLTAALVVGVFMLLDRFERRDETWVLVIAGLALGVTGLVRETWALFTVFVLAWILWRGRDQLGRAFKRAVLFGACTSVVILPWTYRNYQLHDSFVLISTCRWFPIALGNLGEADISEDELDASMKKHKQKTAQMSEVRAEKYWKKVALETISNEQPWWFFEKTWGNTPKLFTLRSQVNRFLRNGWFETEPARAKAIVAYDMLFYTLTMALGLASLWLVRGGGTHALIVAALLFTYLLYIVANATARFVVPLIPLMLLYTGPMLTSRPDDEPVPPWRKAGAAVTVLIFLACVWRSWGGAMRLWETL